MTSRPSPQIVMDKAAVPASAMLVYALLDIYTRLVTQRSLNEIFNESNRVELIDHKTGEIHQFKGSLETNQLKHEMTYDKYSGFKLPKRGALKYSEGKNYSTRFETFLSKLTPEFKSRFVHEEEQKIIS